MVTRRLGTVLVAAALAVAGLPAASSPSAADHAEQQSAASAGTVGRFFAFRAAEVDRSPRAADTAACRERLGEELGAPDAVLLELDVRLSAARTSRRAGRVLDGPARRVGAGYLCLRQPEPSALPTEQGGGSSAYGRLRLPRTGLVELAGWCATVPVLAQVGTVQLNCRLAVLPDRSRGVLRGAVTTSTVLDPTGASVQGSDAVWTAYVERRSWPEGRPRAGSVVAAGDRPAVGSRPSYVVARGRRLAQPPPYDCQGNAHESSLHRVPVHGRTGAVRHHSGRRVGRLLTCTRNFDANGSMTAALRVVGPAGDVVDLEAEGRCTDRGRPTAVLQRTCELRVLPAPHLGVQGGLVTTLGPALAQVTEIGPGDAPLVSVSLVPVG